MKVQRLIRLTHLTSEPLDMVDAKLDDYVNNNTTGIIMPLPTSFLKEGDSISKMGTATTSCIQLSFVSSEFVVQNISFSGYWDNRFNEFNHVPSDWEEGYDNVNHGCTVENQNLLTIGSLINILNAKKL